MTEEAEATETEEGSAVDKLINEYPTTSGVTFRLVDGGLLLRYTRSPDMTDDEAIAYARQNFGGDNPDEVLAGYSSETLAAEGRLAARRENLGGVGITSRTLEDAEQAIPGLTEHLLHTPGKIVFLGNGLSSAPMDMLDLCDSTSLPEVVIVDCYDYHALLRDMDGIRKALADHELSPQPELERKRAKCDQLVDAIDAGRIKSVTCVLGSDQQPEAMHGATLAINIAGPPVSTLDDQLACLAPGGTLLINESTWQEQPSVSATPIYDHDRIVAYSVNRQDS